MKGEFKEKSALYEVCFKLQTTKNRFIWCDERLMKMKKLLLILLSAVLALSLAACGNTNMPNGTYRDSIGFMAITFSKDTVSIYTAADGETTEGTFEMDEDTVNVTFDTGTHDSFVYDKEADTLDWMGEGIIILKKDTQK